MGDPNQPEDCYICDRPTEPGDFCPGCGEWICKECDPDRREEPHEPEEHRRYASD